MAHKIKGSIVLNPAALAPISPESGQMYYNGTDNKLYIYSEGAWVGFGETGTLIRFTQDFTSQTSVVVNHMLVARPEVQVYDSSGLVIIPNSITHNSANQLTVTFGTSQSGTVLCLGGIQTRGPGVYSTQYTVPFVSQTSVVVNHNLGAKPVIQVYDTSDQVLIPTSITHNSVNQSTVGFDVAQSGTVNCLVGGMNNVTAVGNADTVDGFHASQTVGANLIPVTDANNKLPACSGVLLTEMGWTDIVYDGTTADDQGIIAFSSTNWRTCARNTSDGGLTWADNALNSPPSGNEVLVRCVGNSGNAISVGITATPNVYHTENSGASWVVAGTQPSGVTSIIDACYITSGLALIAGQRSASVNIWRSTDQGVNWSVASSGPSGVSPNIVCNIDMFNSSTGILVTDDGSVWSTGDGGLNWIDSSRSATPYNNGKGGEVIAISATSYLFIDQGRHKGYSTNPETSGIFRGSTVANGVLVLPFYATDLGFTNFCRATNGNIYIFVCPHITASYDGGVMGGMLFRTKNNGDSWSVKYVGYSTKTTFSVPYYGESLVEYDTNKLLVKLFDGTTLKVNGD